MEPSEASQSQSKRLSLRPEWRDNRLSFVASIKPTPNAVEAAKSPSMEQSPLTQLARPDVFEPKIVGLYRRLFAVGYKPASHGVPILMQVRKPKMTRNPKAFGASSSS